MYDNIWAAYFRRMFPQALYAVHVTADCQIQRHGSDWIIQTATAKHPYHVDCKLRTGTYSDILLEIYSQCHVNPAMAQRYAEPIARKALRCTPSELYQLFHPVWKVGWAIDASKDNDFIAYCLPDLNKCTLLPYPTLRVVVHDYWMEWVQRSGTNGIKFPIYGQNATYTTVNIAVPESLLREHLDGIRTTCWQKSS